MDILEIYADLDGCHPFAINRQNRKMTHGLVKNKIYAFGDSSEDSRLYSVVKYPVDRDQANFYFLLFLLICCGCFF